MKRTYIIAIVIIMFFLIMLGYVYINRLNQVTDFKGVRLTSGYWQSKIEWNPNNQILAVDSTLYMIGDNRKNKNIPDIQSIYNLTWSSDGSRLAITGNKTWVWDGKQTIILGDEENYRVYWDSVWLENDSKLVVTSSGLNQTDNFLWIWDAITYKLLDKIQGDNSLPVDGEFGDNGFLDIQHIYGTSQVVTSNIGGNAIRFWDIATGKPAHNPFTNLSIGALISVSPNGRAIALADDNATNVQISIDNNLIQIDKLSKSIDQIAWNGSSELLALIDGEEGELTIWNLDQRTAISLLNVPTDNDIKIKWHPYLNKIVVSTQSGVFIIDIQERSKKIVTNKYASQIAWSPDGSKLALVLSDGVHVYTIDFIQ